jgi:hypothetical protein
VVAQAMGSHPRVALVMMAKSKVIGAIAELHLCKNVADDVRFAKKLSVIGRDHNRLTFNSLPEIFPGTRGNVSIPSTDSGNGVGSVSKGK